MDADAWPGSDPEDRLTPSDMSMSPDAVVRAPSRVALRRPGVSP
jgi:hypothetical protein